VAENMFVIMVAPQKLICPHGRNLQLCCITKKAL